MSKSPDSLKNRGKELAQALQLQAARVFDLPRVMRWRLGTRLRRIETESRIQTAVLLDLHGVKDSSANFGLVPFNGQEGRKRAVNAIFGQYRPDVVLETGSYLGSTTAFLAELAGDVRTCEIHPLLHAHAQKKLAAFPHVQVKLMDSRAFLAAEVARLTSQKLFCYLDAHWYGDLPLVAEVQLLSKVKSCLVLIDDFAVPSDPGYGFDGYGAVALNVSLIEKSVREQGWRVYFPTLPSTEETGHKRGWCVLARGGVAFDASACGVALWEPR